MPNYLEKGRKQTQDTNCLVRRKTEVFSPHLCTVKKKQTRPSGLNQVKKVSINSNPQMLRLSKLDSMFLETLLTEVLSTHTAMPIVAFVLH